MVGGILGHLAIIKWWIASGRDLDLGMAPGNAATTEAKGPAKKRRIMKVTPLLERFRENPRDTRHVVRIELGFYDDVAAEMFALVVFVSDGLLRVGESSDPTPPATSRFFSIASRLPLELQMVLCYRLVESGKEILPGKYSEVAFKELAKKFLV